MDVNSLIKLQSMTLQTQDIKMLEDLIRRVVREEIQNAVQYAAQKDGFATEEEFKAAASQIFSSHKKVLDALA